MGTQESGVDIHPQSVLQEPQTVFCIVTVPVTITGCAHGHPRGYSPVSSNPGHRRPW